jgi:hypothetical protein
MTEKLDTKLVAEEIKQTCRQKQKLVFRDSAIDKVDPKNIVFGIRRELLIKFDVPKGSSLKGLNLKISKATCRKYFVLSIWFNNRNQYYTVGTYPNIRCKDVERLCLELSSTHQDDRGLWTKNPTQTRVDEKRLVDKPDTTITAQKSINEVIEDYCKGGFEKDNKEGKRTSKSCQIWLRYMAGYNHRQSLVEFEDDNNGAAIVKFIPNKHLRIIAPKDWRDLFRKYPPGSGVKISRQYYNRRKKKTYTITASENKAIYDTDLGKSLIEDLKPGDIEHWLKDISSSTIKENYLKVFKSLWIWARKKGWLGTNPGVCPISLKTVYIKKEQKKSDLYKNEAIEDPKILDIFWESCEELSKDNPWKAELHQFLLLTSIRKTEAMKYKKEYIDWQKLTYAVPKGISKNRTYKLQPITPELEILFRNILSIGDRPGFEYYKMKDYPWLFGTTKWSASRYFSKEHKQSHKSHLGSDEAFTSKLRELMRYKAEDPDLIYAPKILRKSYITLSQKVHNGRTDITAETSRHEDLSQIKKSYNKPGIETRRAWASEVSKAFTFVKKRTSP